MSINSPFLSQCTKIREYIGPKMDFWWRPIVCDYIYWWAIFEFRAHCSLKPQQKFLALICCPFERVQTILQDSNNNRRFKNTPEIFRKLPVREYYRGIRPILLRNGPSTFLYFYIYDVSSFWVQIGFGDDFIRGALGGVCATLYGYIFNVIKSRQQSILDPAESTRLKRYQF